ncbi:TerC family protein [Paenibacillus thermotolerans]|uniref:TerC family protein n=1 Tax=Paenibacillus thermotolerans TaxID=3027807 RepID=UPI0023684C5D|nr:MULTISPECIES: TerC family protein [unclassified Paenibacillus]
MGMYEANFAASLLSIIIIDLVLAGDNAIVIGLAARRLPKQQQKKVIFWGTAGAIAIRSVLTIAAVLLLKIPGLMLAGGLLLIWIAYKLLAEEKGHGDEHQAASFGEAIRTILIADTLMSLDNVLAVAGAAHGDFLLVVTGLVISIPIVIFGSTIVLRLVDRFPAITYVGAGVLGWTAVKMITDEPFLKGFFLQNPAVKIALTVIVIAGILGFGWLARKSKANHATAS